MEITKNNIESVFEGYELALPSYNDGRELYGYNLAEIVDAVEYFYGCKNRREAFNKTKTLSKNEIDEAVEYFNLSEKMKILNNYE